MSNLDLTAVVLQLVLPLVFIVAIGSARYRQRALLGLDVLLVVAYLGVIAQAGLWLALPLTIPWMLLAFLAAAVAVAARRVGPKQPLSRLGLLSRVAAAVIVSVPLVGSVLGQRPFPDPPLDLSPPFDSGTYLVAAGGSSAWLNPHLKTLGEPRFADFRGQSYALDFVGLGSWGSRRTAAPKPDLTDYVAFGRPVLAPCAGTVVHRSDGQPDELPADTEPTTLEGNHVILECGGLWVILAHLQNGSVAPDAGARVVTGQPIGRIGNSGRSDEPHLHLHAQTPGTDTAPLSGRPVPVTLEGRNLVRNDRVHANRTRNQTVDPSIREYGS